VVGADESPLRAIVVLGASTTAGDMAQLVAKLTRSQVTVVACDVGGLTEPDVTTVDALARLQLDLLRNGRSMTLRRASVTLRELLVLAGLGDVVRVEAPSPFQSEWQAEPGEQAGIDEVREPGEAPG
jgi:hypothetical protein